AKKLNVSFAPLKLSTALKSQLPVWTHLGAPQRTYNKRLNACLQNTHKVRTIKDMKQVCTRLPEHWTHHPGNTCQCGPCKEDCTQGCKDPHKCAQIAADILKKHPPKFEYTTSPSKDDLTLTHRRLEKNA
ncbi:hypothetical protein C8R48DRAFT_591815, partial [Suillus tomentosus]